MFHRAALKIIFSNVEQTRMHSLFTNQTRTAYLWLFYDRTSNIVPHITTCSVSLTSTLQLPATYGHCTMYILHILVVIACTAVPRIFNSCATRESHLTILLRLALINS